MMKNEMISNDENQTSTKQKKMFKAKTERNGKRKKKKCFFNLHKPPPTERHNEPNAIIVKDVKVKAF